MHNEMKDETVIQLAGEMKEVFHKLARQVNLFLLKWGVPLNTYMLLDYLDCHREHAEAAEAADELAIPRQTVTALLDGLEKQGLIARLPHPQDRRRKIIRLTRRGLDKVKRLKAEIHAVETSAYETVGETDLRHLIRIMHQHTEALQQACDTYTGPITPL
ncbi:MAG: MarR family transcriptional regulator [Kiritimatiellae bacterium]|nr:MarR family transcriptional regulator [Kiritimatiellia bacterium]